jgi:hypothetical protein
MATRDRTRRRPRAGPDPGLVEASSLVLASQGVFTLGRVRRSDRLPVDLVGIGPTGPVVAAVLGPGASPAERLDTVVRLLGNRTLGAQVRAGCRVAVLCWGQSAAGVRAVELLRLTAEDYPANPSPA